VTDDSFNAPSAGLKDLRTNYTRSQLDEGDLLRDPIAQFSKWFDEAKAAAVPEPNAMTLATADASGAPSARIVLLKGIEAGGFTFFTNYESRKGHDLAANPRAALCFFWQAMERQVRIEGKIERTSRTESEAYFHSRPVSSQIGAVISHQSGEIASRDELDRKAAELTATYAGKQVPLPDYWGGYRLLPTSIEFWQGRPSRLHDRILYSRAKGGAWTVCRLAP
jgi:pyridoxamine 5'-phosphate oxidase